MDEALFIFYVRDQNAATDFYRRVLECQPRLHVPGMTEFQLSNTSVLGLMPEAGIKRLLGHRVVDPTTANGAPRAELYLRVADPAAYHQRVLENGGRQLDELKPRDWGDLAAYSLDLDGNVLAFARRAS